LTKFTFIDLFAGIGGFHLGLEKNGGECLAFSEIAPNAIQAYCANLPLESYNNLGDITKIESLPQHDLLTAGVPCQSWSIAGKNLGFDDDRGQLWNDTIYLLNKARPKAFIFENVKGLADPRNELALKFILKRIKESGYHAKAHVINSYDYGVVQNRIRVYIVGFKEKQYFDKFKLPPVSPSNKKLYQVLDDLDIKDYSKRKFDPSNLFGKFVPMARTRFQKVDEVNDFFLFNDIRNGHSTIHSWDLEKVSNEEERICYLILKNRRKKVFGPRDGNPLSLNQLQSLDSSIKQSTLDRLVAKGILKIVNYAYNVKKKIIQDLSAKEEIVLSYKHGSLIHLDNLVLKNKSLVSNGVKFNSVLKGLQVKNIISPSEVRYEFKNSKISSGINGINRIYLPLSDVFSTLVASDTNDFVATKNVEFDNPNEYKSSFINQIYRKGEFRKISKSEACRIQGFPSDYKLQEGRTKWMKLIGNSVSVPVIERLGDSIIKTGVFRS